MDKPSEYGVVLRTADLSFLAVVKSLLDSAGVPYVVRGEEALRMIPVGGGFFNPKAFEASLLVRHEDVDEVSRLLAPLETDSTPDAHS